MVDRSPAEICLRTRKQQSSTSAHRVPSQHADRVMRARTPYGVALCQTVQVFDGFVERDGLAFRRNASDR